jgi:predicted nucleic acid-binding protein
VDASVAPNLLLNVDQSALESLPDTDDVAVGIVKTPVFERVASPDSATAVATLLALPTKIFVDASVLVNLLLNVDQSVLESLPDTDDVAVGIVKTPVFESVASPESVTAVAALLALPTKIFVDASVLVSLLLKVDQSVLESLPVFVSDATGILNVRTLPANDILKSVPVVPVVNVSEPFVAAVILPLESTDIFADE